MSEPSARLPGIAQVTWPVVHFIRAEGTGTGAALRWEVALLSTYIIRRVLQMIPVLHRHHLPDLRDGVRVPGDPTAGKCGDRACPPSVVAAITEKYHLNDPAPVGYAKYMANVLQGDLGENRYGIAVADDLKQRYPTTLKLAGLAVLIETVIGILAGVLTAIKRGGFLDNLVLVSTLVVISIPVFVIGSLLLQYTLGIKWGDLSGHR